MTIWQRYTNYLIEWAISHKEEAFAGMTPACFDEWLENEYKERQTINIQGKENHYEKCVKKTYSV